MKLATWNVNSIRARLDRVVDWLRTRAPDVVCLQETKVEDANFPLEELRALGYHAAIHGQRTYNGVAILAHEQPADVERGLGDPDQDPQARFIAATVSGIRVASVYVPNGGTVGEDKWTYKLAFYERLRAWVAVHAGGPTPLAVAGDYNVAPDERDVFDVGTVGDNVLFHPEARAALTRVLDAGVVDAFRLEHDEGGVFTWWDYRQLGFPKNRGLRIDHVLVNRGLAGRVTDVFVDREMRKGKLPSDHAPVMVEIAPPGG